jgi:methylglutaconyl-CoA hydratase
VEQQFPRGYPLQSILVDGVLTVTLPLSERGLLSSAACHQLGAVLDSPPRGAQVLLLESAGTAFCLGRECAVDRRVAVHDALRRTMLVSVAKVHGDAAGFGVELAALSDFAIAASTARFSFPETEISAAEAEALGLLTGVTTADDLDAQTDAIVETLRGRSPRVRREIRDLRGAGHAIEPRGHRRQRLM